MQTATNPETGETVVLIDGAWKKAAQVATNDAGENAYLLEGKWVSDSESATPKEAPKRSTSRELLRQAGLTARAGIEGLTSLPNMVGDAFGLKSTETVKNLLTRIGLPAPETSTERVAQDVAGAMAGAGGIGLSAKAAQATSGIGVAIKDLLTRNMGSQIAASGASGGAAGATRESGGGPLAQLAAGLGAGVGVPVGIQAARGVIPNMIAKSVSKSDSTPFAAEGERVARETGIDISLGARTGNKQVLALENAARQYGPTADRVQNIDVRTANQAIERVKYLADKISSNKTNPDELGKQIESTVKAAAQKIDTLRSNVANIEYGVVREIAGNKPVVKLNNFVDELRSIVGDFENVAGSDAQKIVAQARAAINRVTGVMEQGVPERVIQTPRGNGIKLFGTPTIKGTLDNTIDEAMKTRSFYGKAAKGGANVFEDVHPNTNRTLAARLFGAINRDFEQTSETIGGPLKAALDKANKSYKNYSQSLEYLEKSAIGKLVGDDLVDSAMSGSAISTTAGEEIVKRIAGLHPSTRATSIEILNRWNPALVKDLKASVLQDALDFGMSIPPSAKGASQVPLSFNRFLSALGSTKVSFEKNLKSYGFTSREIDDIRDTAVAIMRAGDKTGFNYSNTEVAKQTLEIAGTLGHSVATGATWGPMAGLRAMGTGAINIAGKRMGLNKIADAMESEAGRKALRTIVSPKASPQAIIASFSAIGADE